LSVKKRIVEMLKITTAFSILLIIICIFFFLFSYIWIDFGLVLMLGSAHPVVNNLLSLIEFGNHHREVLSGVYLLLIIPLFVLQTSLLFSKLHERLTTKALLIGSGVTTLIFSLAYPLFSRDIFTYLFSAKMLWSYHVNPYKIAPEGIMTGDLWLSFIHNIQFTYQYGPAFLLYSLIPMIVFSGKRFIANFLGIKILNAIVFYLGGLLLFKLGNEDKKVFSYWFANPFLVVELLINSHNDLLMICFWMITVFFISQRSKMRAGLALFFSTLTKYISALGIPVLFLSKEKRVLYFKFLTLTIPIFLLIQKLRGFNPWFYSWIYMFAPFSKLKTTSWVFINLTGLLLLLGYYPFIRTGFWGGDSLIPHLRFLLYLLVIAPILGELNLKDKIRFLFSRLFNFRR
jgi:hypothetical protein